jgi:large subunit ribosomal protein L3
MAGQYGNARVTIKNLEVVRFIEEQNLLLVKGAVPGPNGGMVCVRASRKQPR